MQQPGDPTPERKRRSEFSRDPAVASEQGPAQAGQRVYRAVTTLDRLVRNRSLSTPQGEAGFRFRLDWELGVLGARQPCPGSTTTTGWFYPDARLDALRRYRNAARAIGKTQAFVIPIVLADYSLIALANALNLNRKQCLAGLALGLDLLARHYRLTPEIHRT